MRPVQVTEYRERLGNEIRRLRKKNGMSQNELSKRAGISLTWLQKIEYGAVNTSENTLWSIANALNVSIEDLRKENDE